MITNIVITIKPVSLKYYIIHKILIHTYHKDIVMYIS